jgi:hypothetical protein
MSLKLSLGSAQFQFGAEYAFTGCPICGMVLDSATLALVVFDSRRGGDVTTGTSIGGIIGAEIGF